MKVSAGIYVGCSGGPLCEPNSFYPVLCPWHHSTDLAPVEQHWPQISQHTRDNAGPGLTTLTKINISHQAVRQYHETIQ